MINNQEIRIGAYLKGTKEYQFPDLSSKNDKFICIDKDCNKEVILCKGNIRKPYFRHKNNSSCSSYSNSPNESIIHKDAKYKICLLLEKTNIIIERKCEFSKCKKTRCKNKKNIEIEKINKYQKIKQEFPFRHNSIKRQADICCLENGNIKYIIEIMNTSKTKEINRPNDKNWFELKANDVLNQIENNKTLFKCERIFTCSDCKLRIEEETKKRLEEEKIKKNEEKKLERWLKYRQKRNLINNEINRLKFENERLKKIKEKKEKEIQDTIDEEKRRLEREKQFIIDEKKRIEREEKERIKKEKIKQFYNQITFIKNPLTIEEIETNKKSCEIVNPIDNRTIIHYYNDELLICRLPKTSFYKEQYIKYWNKIKNNPNMFNLPLIFTSKENIYLTKENIVEKIIC